MRDHAPVTVQITDDDRDIARRLVLHARNVTEDVARALVEARAAGHAAGVESCEGAADDAHSAGYTEGWGDALAALLEAMPGSGLTPRLVNTIEILRGRS